MDYPRNAASSSTANGSQPLCFYSKARTLESLQQRLTQAKVLPLVRFTVGAFQADPVSILNRIKRHFPYVGRLVIRSSALTEDSLEDSKAGHFRSVLDVPLENRTAVLQAIGQVIASYINPSPEDEVLVQPMLSDVTLSGVMMTADMDTLSPYYIINFDESGSTESVTSGDAQAQIYVHYKYAPVPCRESRFIGLIDTGKELETLFDNPHLDVEFAITGDGSLYILQVRPIVTHNKISLADVDFRETFTKIYKKIERLSAPHPNLLGDRTIFGVMPDWNPAEIIGIRPRALALSLYKELITDLIWAYQRDNYGYRNLRSHPLLISFMGIPFIDIRVDFNSFVPKTLDDALAGKLVNYYLTRLAEKPNLHDKVEFEIVHSCYYLNLPERLAQLTEHGFKQVEINRIEHALRELTNNVIDPNSGLFQQDCQKIEILKQRYDDVMQSGMSVIEKIYWLIEDCKRYGTLPFAGIARAAFIAVQFLHSFVAMGILTQTEANGFLNSLNTVSRQLSRDLHRVSQHELSQDEFLATYGYLRPGTYDILSARYDRHYEGYFGNNQITAHHEPEPFTFTPEQLAAIQEALSENGITIQAPALIQFMRQAIEGRESSKFVFTRSLSQVLQFIEEMGERFEIPPEELSFVNIRTILEMYSNLDHQDVADILRKDSAKHQAAYRYTMAVRLPSLISSPDDIYSFYIDEESPNFVTMKSVEAPIIMEGKTEPAPKLTIVEAKTALPKELTGKIVFIRSADPGYDYLFSHGIAGLVTQFGGANSHMAIRCAELGIPAIIGAGEKLFSSWSKAKNLRINCASKQVNVIA